MRQLFMPVSVVILGLFSSQAHADAHSFCERVAKDYAHANSSDVDKWLADYRDSLGVCTAQNESASKVEALGKKATQKTPRKPSRKIVIAPARSSESIADKRSVLLSPPGSIAWNNYCAAKHPSFNKLTGYYKSKKGKVRRCTDALN
jgi:hypothetical protein